MSDPDALVAGLTPDDVVVLMRERTPFPAAVIDALPRLKLCAAAMRICRPPRATKRTPELQRSVPPSKS